MVTWLRDRTCRDRLHSYQLRPNVNHEPKLTIFFKVVSVEEESRLCLRSLALLCGGPQHVSLSLIIASRGVPTGPTNVRVHHCAKQGYIVSYLACQLRLDESDHMICDWRLSQLRYLVTFSHDVQTCHASLSTQPCQSIPAQYK